MALLVRSQTFLLLSVRAVGSSADKPWPLCNSSYPGYIDLRTVPADLEVPNVSPNISVGIPRPGIRVLTSLPSSARKDAPFFMLYLPPEWKNATARPFPLLVELPGNGPYSSPWGDTSSGRPDDTFLGYGITGGHGAVWASIPFLTAEGAFDQTYWWGCPENGDHVCSSPPAPNTQGCINESLLPPVFNPPSAGCLSGTDTTQSRAFLRAVVEYLITAYNGDASRVVLAGFSRGSIGVNYIGLADDTTAGLWAGSIAYAHYDGQPEDLNWPYPDNTRAAAYGRLKRLGNRPHFVCSELNSTLEQTQPFIEAAGFFVNATYVPTGYCNHNSEWTLRPSPARAELRRWWNGVVGS